MPEPPALSPDRYRIVIGALSARYVRRLDCLLVGYPREEVGSREDPVEGTLCAAGFALRGARLRGRQGGHRGRLSWRRVRRAGKAAVINLGYPWWLLASVLVAFALLLYHVLRGRTSRLPVAALAVVLAPLLTLAALAAAVTLSAVLSPFWEAPTAPSGPLSQTEPATTVEQTAPTTTSEATRPRTASPAASPSASPTTSPSSSASSSASPSP